MTPATCADKSYGTPSACSRSARPTSTNGPASSRTSCRSTGAGQNEELTFALQERERALRVNERRAEEIDSQVRQEVDLQLAQDRINEANFDPERPSGTLVDVFG